MAAVTSWVKEIAVVVLLGWVLEMLVPRDAFRRYVRLVIGLLVLVAVIRPVLTLVGGVDAASFPATADGQVASLIARGEAMQAADESASLAIYAKKVGEEAASIAETVPGVGSATGQASVDTNPGDGTYGEVRSIGLAVTPSRQSIEVGTDGSRPPPAKLASQVQTAVAKGLSVAPSAISVTIRQGG